MSWLTKFRVIHGVSKLMHGTVGHGGPPIKVRERPRAHCAARCAACATPLRDLGSRIWAKRHPWIGMACDVTYPYSPKRAVGFPQAGAMILLRIEVHHTKEVTGRKQNGYRGCLKRYKREGKYTTRNPTT
jgi:hypothetical protein